MRHFAVVGVSEFQSVVPLALPVEKTRHAPFKYAFHLPEESRRPLLREDDEVVGVDNDVEICEMLRPTLTSILPDFEQCGYLAMEALLEKIEHPKRRIPNHMVGIRKIFERESTQDVDGSVRLVTRARAYIADNFGRHLTVPEIAASVKASRRLLEMKFRQVTGGTVHDEIERVRMDEAKRLLVNTKRPISEISAACGFSSDISFRFAFRRVFGVPPTSYR